jgi:hypothetical protein
MLWLLDKHACTFSSVTPQALSCTVVSLSFPFLFIGSTYYREHNVKKTYCREHTISLHWTELLIAGCHERVHGKKNYLRYVAHTLNIKFPCSFNLELFYNDFQFKCIFNLVESIGKVELATSPLILL